MRVLLIALCLVAAALAQLGYGNAPASLTLTNGTTYSASSFGVPSFLTAEDRRFAIALNWARQDPATFKSLMQAQSKWDIIEPFLVPGNVFQPSLALHFSVNIAGAAHYHVYEEAVNSVLPCLSYDSAAHCANPKKWPSEHCSPPDLFTPTGSQTPQRVECFRREGCTDPTIDYYNRMGLFDVPIYPLKNTNVAGGEFIAAGQVYTADDERQMSAAMSLVCDSADPVNQPYNCTADNFGGDYDTAKEILYRPLGLRIAGTGYYAQGNTKQASYFDTYFAAAPEPTTANPIATGGFIKVNNNGYFVLNYREPSSDSAAPNTVGVIYQAPSSGAVTKNLAHANSAALVYTLQVSNLLSQCGAGVQIPYCLWAVDSSGTTYRYPEDANLDLCAGTSGSSSDILSDPSAGVDAGAVKFLGSSTSVPTAADPANQPSIPFGGSASAVLLPAIVLIMVALSAMLTL